MMNEKMDYGTPKITCGQSVKADFSRRRGQTRRRHMFRKEYRETMLRTMSAVAILGTPPIFILRSPIRNVFRRICTFAFLFGALTTAASGQRLAVGVKGGVPLLDAFGGNTFVSEPFFQDNYTFNTKRFTVGPAVEVSLPLKLRFEANALYTRLDYDQTSITGENVNVQPLTTSVTYTYTSATRANSWQFPLLLKKEIPVGRVRPFGDIGYALRHVSGTSHIAIMAAGTTMLDQTLGSQELAHTWVHGYVVGGGLTFQSGPLKFSPEVRYTRWADPNFRGFSAPLQSNLNQVDFLLGIAWSRF